MCGIIGIWNFDGKPVNEDNLLKGMELMKQRGPDDKGSWTEKGVGMGHTRLSIIDLSEGGHQPMLSSDNSAVIVFNGELYNYRELKEELLKEGCSFRTMSDTEVLLEGYLRWGIENLLERSRGMWAFAIYDIKRKKMVLSRDRFGKKPLFYKMEPNRIIFASTLVALQSLMSETGEINYESVDFFINFGYVPSSLSIYRDISKCQPSEYIEIFDNNAVIKKKYWLIKFYEEEQHTFNEWVEEVEYLLKEAVKDRLVADVPVSAFLSGGVDSTLIVSLMCELGKWPKTFTMTVPGSWRDESQRARLVASKYRTNHTEIPLDPHCIKKLPHLLYEFGEPFADSSAIPTYYVASQASKETKVILTGDGGDEIFGGYGRLDSIIKLENSFLKTPFFLKSLYFVIGKCLENYKVFCPLQNMARRLKTISNGLKEYFSFLKRLPEWRKKSLYGKFLMSEVKKYDLEMYFYAMVESDEIKNIPWMKQLLKIDIMTTLVGDFLTKIDIGCMSNSIEARCPFLDHRLLEKVWRMPLNLWQYNGNSKGFLKMIAGKRLPKEVILSPKHGFTIPVETFWDEGWINIVERFLFKGKLVHCNFLKEDGIKQLVGDVRQSKRGKDSQLLYHLLCLELWFRIFIEKEDVQF